MTLTTLLAAGTATVAGAHPDVPKWWQYDRETWHHTWRSSPELRREQARWEQMHQYSSEPQNREERRWLRRQYLRMHFHHAISFQTGQATWYNGDGVRGACGKTLTGLYAASRTMPCGSLVSVRANGRYVLVRILDRGPYGSDSRILDLSPRAFSVLAPTSAGVIDVRAVQLGR